MSSTSLYGGTNAEIVSLTRELNQNTVIQEVFKRIGFTGYLSRGDYETYRLERDAQAQELGFSRLHPNDQDLAVGLLARVHGGILEEAALLSRSVDEFLTNRRSYLPNGVKNTSFKYGRVIHKLEIGWIVACISELFKGDHFIEYFNSLTRDQHFAPRTRRDVDPIQELIDGFVAKYSLFNRPHMPIFPLLYQLANSAYAKEKALLASIDYYIDQSLAPSLMRIQTTFADDPAIDVNATIVPLEGTL